MKYRILLCICFVINNLFSTELMPRGYRRRKRTFQEVAGSAHAQSDLQRAPKRRRKERKKGALHNAIEERDRQKIKELLSPKKGPGANPNRPDEWGMTPAHYIVQSGWSSLFHTIEKHQAHRDRFNSNLQDDKGNTPLHLACSLGDEKMSLKLLKRGASLETRNNGGRTPLEVAQLAGRLKCVAALQEFLAKDGKSVAVIKKELSKRDEGEAARSAAAAQEEQEDICMICRDELTENRVFLFTCKHSLCSDCSEGQAATHIQCFLCPAKIKKELTFEERIALKEADDKRRKEADERASEAEVLRLLAEEFADIE